MQSIKFVALVLAACLMTSMSGCVIVNGEPGWYGSDWEDEQRENREIISALEIGMEREQVVGRLGTPNFSEAFSRDGEEFRVLFFRTQHRRADGDTTRDETTPLVFQNDTLIGWGNDVLASIRQPM